MKKKYFVAGLVLAGMLGLVACGENNSEAVSSSVTENSTNGSAVSGTASKTGDGSKETEQDTWYSVKVTDIDGEVLLDETYKAESNSFLTDVRLHTEVLTSSSSYGESLISIAGSVYDANWYMASYENGSYATTGIDGLVIDNGDKFEFTAECWNTVSSGYGTMSENDVKLDKAVYHYAKKYLSTAVSSATTYTGSDYWSFINYYLLKNAGYKAEYSLSADLQKELSSADLSTLSGADFGKYYYAARLADFDMTDFKTAFSTALKGITEYSNYGEYTLPFELAPAYTLGLKNDVSSDVIHTSYVPGTSYGYDGYNWFYTANSLYKTYQAEDLSLPAALQGNATSDCATLATYAALNTKNDELFNRVMNTYYDDTACEIFYSTDKKSDGLNYMSANQVYAYLTAYKVMRDNGKAVNVFA